MKNICKGIALMLLATLWTGNLMAQEVSVVLTTDESFSNKSIINKMSQNLSKTLTEINCAHKENRPLNIVDLPLNKEAQDALLMLWANIHFYCDDEEIVERCWYFNNGEEYMVNHIPLIITVEGEEYGNGTFQEAVIDFDKHGTIKDFRFSLDAQLGESMENCGDVAGQERIMRIKTYCERFRTAYNTKDLEFLRQVFSDDALIITGSVTIVNKADTRYSKMKVNYKKQNKQEYLANLERAFRRNKWINVKFSQIPDDEKPGGCPGITRSKSNPNMYGVRLHQEWTSSNYSDTGYLFLLWDFTDEDRPVIHVRTWQPDYANGVKLEPDDEISTLGAFNL